MDAFDFIRTIAVARHDADLAVRLSAGREQMNEANPGDVLYGRGELDFLWLQIVNYARPARGRDLAVIP